MRILDRPQSAATSTGPTALTRRRDPVRFVIIAAVVLLTAVAWCRVLSNAAVWWVGRPSRLAVNNVNLQENALAVRVNDPHFPGPSSVDVFVSPTDAVRFAEAAAHSREPMTLAGRYLPFWPHHVVIESNKYVVRREAVRAGLATVALPVLGMLFMRVHRKRQSRSGA